MTIFHCARLDEHENIDVAAEISALNRMLERRFPDCTVQSVGAGDHERSSQWVMVDLEITPQSLVCAQWYAAELAQKGIVLQERGRRAALEA